jgi:hypothetical protein
MSPFDRSSIFEIPLSSKSHLHHNWGVVTVPMDFRGGAGRLLDSRGTLYINRKLAMNISLDNRNSPDNTQGEE